MLTLDYLPFLPMFADGCRCNGSEGLARALSSAVSLLSKLIYGVSKTHSNCVFRSLREVAMVVSVMT